MTGAPLRANTTLVTVNYKPSLEGDAREPCPRNGERKRSPSKTKPQHASSRKTGRAQHKTSSGRLDPSSPTVSTLQGTGSMSPGVLERLEACLARPWGELSTDTPDYLAHPLLFRRNSFRPFLLRFHLKSSPKPVLLFSSAVGARVFVSGVSLGRGQDKSFFFFFFFFFLPSVKFSTLLRLGGSCWDTNLCPFNTIFGLRSLLPFVTSLPSHFPPPPCFLFFHGFLAFLFLMCALIFSLFLLWPPRSRSF